MKLTSESEFEQQQLEEEEEPSRRHWQHHLQFEREEFVSRLKKTSDEVDPTKDLPFQFSALQFLPS